MGRRWSLGNGLDVCVWFVTVHIDLAAVYLLVTWQDREEMWHREELLVLVAILSKLMFWWRGTTWLDKLSYKALFLCTITQRLLCSSQNPVEDVSSIANPLQSPSCIQESLCTINNPKTPTIMLVLPLWHRRVYATGLKISIKISNADEQGWCCIPGS